MKKMMFTAFLLINAFLLQAQNKYEKNILDFEKSDKASSVDTKKLIVFTGSSSIVKWQTLNEDFPNKNVINRGFGGSHTSDLIEFSDRIVSAYHPKQVLIYEGDNDLAGGKSPSQVLNDFKTLFHNLRAKGKKIQISFITIKPSISRSKLLPQINETNALIAAFLKTQRRTDYIDVFTPMLTVEGNFKPELYQKDNLHMTEKGYEIWTQTVKPYLK